MYEDSHTTVFQSALVLTNSTVIETDDLVLVIDPAWLPNEVEQIKQEVDRRQKGRPVYLLFTHSHFDHVLGYGAFPEAKTIGSVGTKKHPEKANILNKIKMFDDELYLHRNYGIHYPNIDYAIEEDGQTLSIGKTKLTFYQAQGHSSDGFFTLIDSLGVFIAGDHLSDVEFPFIEDSKEYERTLEKAEWILQHHPVQLLIPGHGSPTKKMDEIIRRQKGDLEYIRTIRNVVLGIEENIKLDQYIHRYEFVDGIRGYHKKNIEVIKKELGLL
ncbi:MBL fold metallo-hydrolase [Bacillus sp. FJAT-49736]|nr:MBL fold metallo-hydrolase [Bacillus sp. FJAT-49736]